MSLKSANKVDVNRYELEIIIDADTFLKACQQAYRKNVKKMNVPGFRKGKAPQSIVEKLYGEKIFYDDALESLYPDALQSAVDEAGLEMIEDSVDVDVVSAGKDGAEIKVQITVKPEVSIKDYKGLKAERPRLEVTEADVDDEINRLRERNSRTVTVEDRAAKDGDIAVIDFEGFIDGEAFEGGKGESYSLTLGSNQFIPGFEKQVEGHSSGDEFEVNVSFPEEYHAEELKGKEAVFKVTLHEIKEKEMPEADDEFVKDVSEFDTLDELRADQKAKILESRTEKADGGVETALLDQLSELVEAEIPEAMFEQRLKENLRDFDFRLRSQGMDLETYIGYMGGDEEAIKDQFRPQAERQVKIRLALEKIAELEGLSPTDEEIETEEKRLADSYKVEVEKIRIAVPRKDVVLDLSTQKALDFVKENAVITEVVEAEQPEGQSADTNINPDD